MHNTAACREFYNATGCNTFEFAHKMYLCDAFFRIAQPYCVDCQNDFFRVFHLILVDRTEFGRQQRPPIGLAFRQPYQFTKWACTFSHPLSIRLLLLEVNIRLPLWRISLFRFNSRSKYKSITYKTLPWIKGNSIKNCEWIWCGDDLNSFFLCLFKCDFDHIP